MKKTLIVVAILAIFGSILTYKMLHLAQLECGLCIDFNSQRQCSRALGPTEAEALDEAHRNACAILASGVTQVVACNRAERKEVFCQNKPDESD